MESGTVFTTLHFSQLTNGPNMLAHYIALSKKSLLITNTLAYRAYS